MLKTVAQITLAALCLTGMWLHVDRVVVGHQVTEAAQLGIPRGNLSDLYPVWIGSREVLVYHRNPYSLDVRQEIQTGYYGRPIVSSRPNDPTNQQAFAYPVYVAFLLAPTLKLSFSSVRVLFFWLLSGLTALSVTLWLRMLRWHPGWRITGILIILTLGSFATVQGLKLQQLSLLVAFLIAGALALVSIGQFVLAGVLLALAMVKPQLTLPVSIWLMLWAFSAGGRRRILAVSFALCLAAVVVGSELVLPGWMPKFIGAVAAYETYAASGPLLSQMLPRMLAFLLIAATALALAILCWRMRRRAPDTPEFVYTTSLILAVTLLLIPMYPPHYQLLLLPGIFLLAQNRRELWSQSIGTRVLLITVAVPLIWSWASAIVLAGASFFTPRVQNFWQVPLWTSVVLPIPVVACLGLLTFRKIFDSKLRLPVQFTP